MNKFKSISFKKVFAWFVIYNVISIFVFLMAVVADGASSDYLSPLFGAYLGIRTLGILVAAGIWAAGVLHE